MSVERCVVSVGTSHYIQYLERLRQAVARYGCGASTLICPGLPEGCPPHADRPYAFKAFALKQAADRGADLVLWCDSVVEPIRDMGPLWERIERDGYWISICGWTNYEWTADSAYKDMYPGVPIEEAREMNKRFPQVTATAFGLNLRSLVGADFLKEYYRLANTEAFCGPWANENCPTAPHYGKDSSYKTEPCGPPDVMGHRHDQTVASMLAYRLGMQLTNNPLIFGYSRKPEETILLANGGIE